MKTTLAKAKAVRPFAEKMITLGKRGDLHSRRVASASLRQKEAVRKLFAELAGAAHQRPAGWLLPNCETWSAANRQESPTGRS
jgi:large subunit ribosomal protein L17